MEFFSICSKIIQEEKRKCNLDHQQIIQRTIEFSLCDNFFESPYDRCAFMYKNATCIIGFTKNCVYKFLQECPIANDMLLKWKVLPSLQFCSFSHGPALDYLAFCVALSENVEINLQPTFSSVNIISNSAQWKHAIHFMTQSIEMGYLNSFPVSKFCDNFYVNQNPRLVFNDKQKLVVQEADVVFMVKTLNFSKPDEFKGRKIYFQNIVAAMKFDSYLFCIDTKPSISAMFEIFCQIPGVLIYGPVLNAYQFPEKFPETYKEIYGCLPVVSARGNFFVWKKISLEFQVPNLCGVNSKKLPLTDPRVSMNNMAGGLNCDQNSQVQTNLKHDISNQFNEGSYNDKQSADLFNDQNFTLRKKNFEELTNKSEDSSSLYSNLEKNLLNGTVSTEEINETIEQNVKAVLANICDVVDHDQKSQPVSMLDQLFSKLSPAKYELPPNTETEKLNDSLARSNDLKKSDLVIEGSVCQNNEKICDDFDYNQLEDEVWKNTGSLEKYWNTEVRRNSGSLSSILSDSSNSQNAFSTTSKTLKRRQRRAKNSLNSSLNSNDIKISRSSTPVKVIPLYSSVCGMPTSSNSNSMPNHVNLNTNIERELTDKSQGTGKEISNSDKNCSFFYTKLNGNVSLKKVRSCDINKSNISPSQASLKAPENEQFQLTADHDVNNSVSPLFHRSVSTTTNIENSSSGIQQLTNRIKTLVSSFDQILNQKEIDATFREDEAMGHFHNNQCSSSSSIQNVADNDLHNNDSFRSSNIASNRPKELDGSCEKLEIENKNSNLDAKSKGFCLQQSSLCCATQFCCHKCCVSECRKVFRCACACVAPPTCPLRGCIHCAEQCVPLSNQPSSRFVSCEQVSPTVPNIVIPLQNITADAVAQILTILKESNADSTK